MARSGYRRFEHGRAGISGDVSHVQPTALYSTEKEKNEMDYFFSKDTLFLIIYIVSWKLFIISIALLGIASTILEFYGLKNDFLLEPRFFYCRIVCIFCVIVVFASGSTCFVLQFRLSIFRCPRCKKDFRGVLGRMWSNSACANCGFKLRDMKRRRS